MPGRPSAKVPAQDENDSGGRPPQEPGNDRLLAQRRASGWLPEGSEDLRAGGATLDRECRELFPGECEHKDGDELEQPGRESGTSSTPGGAGSREGREARPGDSSVPAEGSPGDVMDLTKESICALASVWQPNKNPFGEEWQALVQKGRPLLMELACYEDSVLSREVIRRFGPGSAIRCGLFNGVDLETAKGVQLAEDLVQKHRPSNVWISCDCSPFCPLQRLNRGTPERAAALEAKRARALKQYKGAQEVAVFATTLGSQIHWELAERCEAWKLPLLESFVAKLGLEKVTCHGCAVGLRLADDKRLLCKGWTIATHSQAVRRHMHLVCQKNHPKGECRGKSAEASSRYTPVFAKKIVDCFCEQEVWPKVVQELACSTIREDLSEAQALANDEIPVGGPPEPHEAIDPASRARRKEILKKVQHIHRVTGHGNMASLIQALEARGVSEEVLEVAKSFRCPVCEERKRPSPRRQSTLETLPKKWERLQIDTGDWVHPVHGHKFRFAVPDWKGFCRPSEESRHVGGFSESLRTSMASSAWCSSCRAS